MGRDRKALQENSVMLEPRALDKDPVLILAGPTASGKSALAVELALSLRELGRPAEILCADSITVYRGFEIGAAKPSLEDRARVKHHLVDVADPSENFTAGDFTRLSLPIIESLHQEKKIPILVGGTGFYLRALLSGMATKEEESSLAKAVKSRLERRAKDEGWSTLYRELLTKDPASSAVVHENDHYRILRALQAMEIHGGKWSELNQAARQSEWRFPGARYFCLQIDREELRQRVTLRTEKMLQEGIVEEVQSLLDQGVPVDAKPMQSVGYKECIAVISGQEARETLKERIIQSTMKLAKQQMTWFRGEKKVEWLNPPTLESAKNALALPESIL